MAQLANKIKEHFLNPRNVGRIQAPTCTGEAGSLSRGSGIKLFLKLSDNGTIEKATYQIFNNAPAIAPASAFTELVAGKSLTEADDTGRKEIMDFLECDEESAGNIRFDILEAYQSAVTAFHEEGFGAEGGHRISAGGGDSPAGAAEPSNTHVPTKGEPKADKPKLMLMQLVQDVLDSEIRPAVAMDGGDVELVDIEGKRVLLRLHGHCVGCSSSQTTMRFFIEDRLKQLVDPGIEVIDTTEFEGETHAPPGFLPV